MGQTKARIGYGTLLQKGDNASPPNYTTIAEVKEISGFGFTASLQEATHMESPNQYKEYVAGMKDADTMNIRVNMTVDNEDVLKAAADAGTAGPWRITKPGGLATRSYTGVPVAYHEQGMTPDGILECTFGLKVSGAIA
jgi:Lambda phage tail tube protein, TTP